MADNRDTNAAMTVLARWAGPFTGATAALGAVVGFVILGGGGQQVPVPSAAVVQAASSPAGGDDTESSSPSPPFTVVYPKRTVDVVEVPGAEDETPSADPGVTSPPHSLQPTVSSGDNASDDGGDQTQPPAGANPPRGGRESDDSRVSRQPSPTPTRSPSETRSPSPTWTNDDEGDGAHSPDS